MPENDTNELQSRRAMDQFLTKQLDAIAKNQCDLWKEVSDLATQIAVMAEKTEAIATRQGTIDTKVTDVRHILNGNGKPGYVAKVCELEGCVTELALKVKGDNTDENVGIEKKIVAYEAQARFFGKLLNVVVVLVSLLGIERLTVWVPKIVHSIHG